jgi:signal transduction histidine kinase
LLRLVVEDNGTGFDPAAVEVRSGLGMRSMQTRAARLGGNLTVRSNESGTVLTLAVKIGPSTVAAEPHGDAVQKQPPFQPTQTPAQLPYGSN